ncbi:MAG: hypothetical protein IJC76_06750 [Lachnospiraceae bacterium]|nr:hypothetical protein [Lachnospiraceae bacterium]
MKMIQKGEKGYINHRKLVLLLTVLVLMISVAVFFFTGYIRYKSTKTIFTVLAVLMVLPAAKQFVMYAVISSYKSADFEMYDYIKSLVDNCDVQIISDLVITSPEKVTNIDFICVKGAKIIGYAPHKKVDIDFITNNLRNVINPYYKINQIKFYTEYDKFKNAVENMKDVESYKYDEDIANLILTQCV